MVTQTGSHGHKGTASGKRRVLHAHTWALLALAQMVANWESTETQSLARYAHTGDTQP